jgi:alanine-glyoxylate transaminase/serine-glyoxylate transaminase/serine-pyruvate transaminase
MSLLANYWGSDRVYHHTAPISMIYALHEALSIIVEEGMEARAERHRRNHLAFVAGVEAMGMKMQVDNPAQRLWSLNAVVVPDGVDEAAVRGALLHGHGIEIGGGLGPLAGKIWRVGLMGASSTSNNVLLLLAALEGALKMQGHAVPEGAGVAAAVDFFVA